MQLNSFENKVAIVTGAGQGIGFEMARLLAERGAAVVLNDIDFLLAKNAADEINSSKQCCVVVAGDAAAPAIIEKMVATAVNAFGHLDILIANAGITLFGAFLTYPLSDFTEVLRVNLTGSFFLAQAAANQMSKQGFGGSVLFTSSVTGHQAHKNLAAYGMTKAALEMLAKNLVIELSPYKITVNAVAPGATLTQRTTGDVEYEKIWSAITPMGRPSTTTDIAETALFLVSEKARQITGQTIIVDGGWTAVSPSPYPST